MYCCRKWLQVFRDELGEFIEKRIMQPLNMTGSASSFSRLKDKSNVIDPHAPVNGKSGYRSGY
jgi:hypothetical protein